jgi:hypothetical protein
MTMHWGVGSKFPTLFSHDDNIYHVVHETFIAAAISFLEFTAS